MKKALKNDMKWNEQVKIAVKLPDTEDDNSAAYEEATSRIAELTRKKYKIVDTYTDEAEQVFVLEEVK